MTPTHVTIAGHVAEEGSEAARLLWAAHEHGCRRTPEWLIGRLTEKATRSPGYVSPAPTNPRTVTREE